MERRNISPEGLNREFTVCAIRKVIGNLKKKKAVGIDNLPNEILKNEVSIQVLHNLFKLIFKSGIIPTDWTFAIIKPIPKNLALDPRFRSLAPSLPRSLAPSLPPSLPP